MTKQELIDFINQLPCDDFKVERKISRPSERFDLPDMRMGAVYPPYNHMINTVVTTEVFDLTISGMFNKKRG